MQVSRSPRPDYLVDLERNEEGKAFPYSNAVAEVPSKRAAAVNTALSGQAQREVQMQVQKRMQQLDMMTEGFRPTTPQHTQHINLGSPMSQTGRSSPAGSPYSAMTSATNKQKLQGDPPPNGYASFPPPHPQPQQFMSPAQQQLQVYQASPMHVPMPPQVQMHTVQAVPMQMMPQADMAYAAAAEDQFHDDSFNDRASLYSQQLGSMYSEPHNIAASVSMMSDQNSMVSMRRNTPMMHNEVIVAAPPYMGAQPLPSDAVWRSQGDVSVHSMSTHDGAAAMQPAKRYLTEISPEVKKLITGLEEERKMLKSTVSMLEESLQKQNTRLSQEQALVQTVSQKLRECTDELERAKHEIRTLNSQGQLGKQELLQLEQEIATLRLQSGQAQDASTRKLALFEALELQLAEVGQRAREFRDGMAYWKDRAESGADEAARREAQTIREAEERHRQELERLQEEMDREIRRAQEQIAGIHNEHELARLHQEHDAAQLQELAHEQLELQRGQLVMLRQQRNAWEHERTRLLQKMERYKTKLTELYDKYKDAQTRLGERVPGGTPGFQRDLNDSLFSSPAYSQMRSPELRPQPQRVQFDPANSSAPLVQNRHLPEHIPEHAQLNGFPASSNLFPQPEYGYGSSMQTTQQGFHAPTNSEQTSPELFYQQATFPPTFASAATSLAGRPPRPVSALDLASQSPRGDVGYPKRQWIVEDEGHGRRGEAVGQGQRWEADVLDYGKRIGGNGFVDVDDDDESERSKNAMERAKLVLRAEELRSEVLKAEAVTGSV